jgi:hypothetical protein
VVGRTISRSFARSNSKTQKENLMKNVTLFACLLVLTLGASAQSAISVSSAAISPNAHNGAKADAHGVTTADRAVSAKSASANPNSAISGGPQGPPVSKAPANAVTVSSNAKK